MDLWNLTLRELAAGVREKRHTAAEVARAHAARIDALEPKVKAWVALDAERAIARAEVLDSTGPLAGVPLAIKDIIDVAGLPTRCGSPIYESAAVAKRSAACVTALENAGGVIFGKSVTTEFAYYTPRKTRNPWNLKHTPGGSSMGSAAAVACGMVAGALGTQTNGSVIRPAAFCGVVGFKPSFGAISNDGTMDPWPTLDHTGVFARNVADAATLAAVVAADVSAAVAPPREPPRIAVVRTPVWPAATAAQREMLAGNADAFERAGAKIDELELPAAFEGALEVHRTILAYEGAKYFGPLQEKHALDMGAQINALIDYGMKIEEAAYREALAAAAALRETFARTYDGYDAIVTPPSTGEAPATLAETGSPAFCTIWTLLGVPAIAIPVALGAAGLPLGLQIVGRHAEDDRVLAVAAWCEGLLGGAVRTPVTP
ncbi:MAG TPA: amidase [Burkholderiales bacterium]|nr:amidase [Burkholderiales bacterium]